MSFVALIGFAMFTFLFPTFSQKRFFFCTFLSVSLSWQRHYSLIGCELHLSKQVLLMVFDLVSLQELLLLKGQISGHLGLA
jgi:hypothetical protein